MPTPSRSWLLGLTVGAVLGAVLGAATVSRGVSGRGDATLEARVAQLEATIQGLQGLIDHVSFVEGSLDGVNGPHLLFEGVNVHIRSGSGSTTDGLAAVDFPPVPGALHGLGNLFIGYNEEPAGLADGERGGSHMLVIGDGHRYASAGGAVFGSHNTVTGLSAAVTGGAGNTASGAIASVTGGGGNIASGPFTSVSGGRDREAGGADDWVAGSMFEDN